MTDVIERGEHGVVILFRHAVCPSSAGMTSDEENEVFNYGDRTIFQLRAQAFAIEHEYGTMILPVGDPQSVPEPPPPPPAIDATATVEQKLDLLLRQVATLQMKIDSIDATLARLLTR